MKTTKLFTLLAAVPFLLASCLNSNDDENKTAQNYDVIETTISFEDATLNTNGTMQGNSYISKGENAYVFDNFVETFPENDSTVSYGYTVSNLTNINTGANASPYAAFTSMISTQGSKFVHYIPNEHNPQYIHRTDGKTFKPYYMELAISSKTLQAAINGFGDEKPFTENDSISVSIRGVETLGTGSTNKLNFNIIYKNGLLQLDSYNGYYGYLNFKYLGSYNNNLWVPMYLTSLETVSKILIEIKSTRKNMPLGIAIDNFTTYTTKTTETATDKK